MSWKLATVAGVALMAAVAVTSPASAASMVGLIGPRALNPQPLPPRYTNVRTGLLMRAILRNRFGNVMLNPQPLPPRVIVR